MVKNPYLQCRRSGLDPWVGKIPWRRKWLPTPEFLPGRSHEQRKTSIPSSTNNSKTQRKCLLILASIFCLCEVFYIRLWANNCLKSLEPASLSPLIHRAAAAAAAKSLQSCPTLCDPIDGSPPGSAVPGILQAKTLEWVAISFSNAWKRKVNVKSLSRVQLFMTPWTEAYQAPPSVGFSRQEYWSGFSLPSTSTELTGLIINRVKSSHQNY